MKKELKMNYAKILFQELGSTESPNKNANNFLNFIANYQNAKAKLSIIEELKDLLSGDISGFEFDLEHESDDEGGTYLSPYVTSVYDQDGVEADDLDSDVIQDFLYELDDDMKETLSGTVIQLKELDKLKNSLLDKHEVEAFDLVNNFERHLIDEKIPESTKPKKEMKI